MLAVKSNDEGHWVGYPPHKRTATHILNEPRVVVAGTIVRSDRQGIRKLLPDTGQRRKTIDESQDRHGARASFTAAAISATSASLSPTYMGRLRVFS